MPAQYPTLTTTRLTLRPWHDNDIAAFAAINQDAAVMRWRGAPLTYDQTQAWVGRMQQTWQEHGLGLFAAELRDTPGCIGYIGLSIPRFTAHFTPCVEIGWRLASAMWGQGLASEGASAVLAWARDDLHLPAVVSFTTRGNVASQRVMQKIGMHYDPADDFDHPMLPADHPLRPHVLYRYDCS
jgi:RimJ/RimL family protein N-acetyltransferase